MILALFPGLSTGTDTDTVASMNCLPVLFARASLKLNSESTKKELEKELDVVNQIQGKLGGLKVTDTAATGLKAEQKDTQAAPAAEPAAVAADGARIAKEKAEKEAEAERLAEELEEKRIAEQQAAAEVAAAAAKAKANQNKPVPNGDGSCPRPKMDEMQAYMYSHTSKQLLNPMLTKHQVSGLLERFQCETLAQFKALGSPSLRTGLAGLIEEWFAGDQKRIDVVAKYGKIENWNMKFVTNLKCVFSGAKQFNANISQWDVSNVTTLEQSKSSLANC